ncbi:MAG: type VII secretion integral membrane protein EccD [Mycobacterium sp.]|uniref:type VII secretion integral membrane protein EccD n=1 Tax=Mycobacterium sp. TaxID=1785 RepID=UPI000CAD44F4|nr:type VII secretion integral membrane protein EccD [Mycobacterium sp.]PJE02613.1 MAG: type VII secretion integral membrane protein EccD [Mycobacterium sp.]PJE10706.1 MAG: type VII secretion integral membrane protein EccD [Mycobacterium sp.]PJE25356.1 MAG: type VII secretion integral membrane protein EccD [Mycobacterium sp.]
MDPAAATGQIRVAVIGEDTAADLALPTSLAIRELIPRIRATLASKRDDDDIVADAGDTMRPYSLAPLGGTPFSLDATLGTLAIDDGEQLLLCRLPPGPAAPPVVEDIADASAIHSASQFKPFEHPMLRTAAQVTVLVFATLVCGLAVYGWWRGYRGWSSVGCGVLAVTLLAATVWLHRRGSTDVSTRLGIAVTVPLGLAAAAALPGDASAPRLFLSAALLLAWSLLLLALTDRWASVHAATLAISTTVALAAAVRIVWHLPFLTIGCGVLAISLLLASNAPTISAMWARFPLPNVPAPGEPTPAPSSLAEIEELPRKTAACNAYQSGLVAASVILSVLGSVLVVWLPAAPSLLAWWLVVVITTVTVLRMRIWDSAVPAFWFLATPLVTAVALSVSFAATGHLVASMYALAVVAALTATILIAAAVRPKELSIPQRRWLDLAENTLLVTIPPAMLWLIGLISLIRNRGAL